MSKPKKSETPVAAATPCSDFLREQVRLLQKAGWIAHAKEFETAITALRVIHTWATFDGGRCLNPQDVAKLTRKALKGFISSSPNIKDHATDGARDEN
jgi:hypothetical protein